MANKKKRAKSQTPPRKKSASERKAKAKRKAASTRTDSLMLANCSSKVLRWEGIIHISEMRQKFPGPFRNFESLTPLSWIMVAMVIVVDVLIADGSEAKRLLYDSVCRLLEMDSKYIQKGRVAGEERGMKREMQKFVSDNPDLFPEGDDLFELEDLLLWILETPTDGSIEVLSEKLFGVVQMLSNMGFSLAVSAQSREGDQPLVTCIIDPDTSSYRLERAHKPISGSHALIYKATRFKENLPNEDVAVKRYTPPPERKRRHAIVKEFNLLRRCQHRNIVQAIGLYRSVEESKTYYDLIIKPWAPITLQDLFLPNTQCDWDCSREPHVAYGIFRDVADGLRYLHQQEIEHKDIKPTNILLHQTDGPPRTLTGMITDFDISKLEHRGTMTDYTGGTYHYLAPEQDSREGSSLASDVFSLGCCFLEVVVLGRSGFGQLEDVIDGNKKRSYQYGRELKHVREFIRLELKPFAGGDAFDMLGLILKMLEREPQSRPTMEWLCQTDMLRR